MEMTAALESNQDKGHYLPC